MSRYNLKHAIIILPTSSTLQAVNQSIAGFILHQYDQLIDLVNPEIGQTNPKIKTKSHVFTQKAINCLTVSYATRYFSILLTQRNIFSFV